MLEIAARKLSHKATLIHADIREMAFPENHFDCTICYCILPIINGHKVVFNTLARSTRSFVISIYNKEAIEELETFYRQNGFSPRTEGNTLFLEEGFSYDFLSKETICDMFRENRFETREIKYEIGTLYIGNRA